ncbi:hypothetical protein NDU88_002627 [Pleurodeles waltl]|uniref:Uncharacterized protein n=1 Tax=Pleurodeles waltl TaxID=8319 RepID=A0AAV7M317_PLEWA|nr:hypothetical protein NDU88_002627 [Pleurodeles waltl]
MNLHETSVLPLSEPLAHPLAPFVRSIPGSSLDWVLDLGTASGLDSSPEFSLLSSASLATEAITAFADVLRQVSAVLGLHFPLVQLSIDPVLSFTLDQSDTEPVLPFCKALYDILLGVWTQPVSGPLVDRSVSHRHWPVQRGLLCLCHHPPPQGFVIQTALGTPALEQFPPTSLHRDSRQLDTAGRCFFSSSSAALHSTNNFCVLSCFSKAPWDSVKCLLPSLSGDVCPALTSLIRDGQQAARLGVRSSMDSAYSIGHFMADSVAIHRRAWLAASNFSSPVRDALLDMPFDGKSLFGTHADSALRRFCDSHGGVQCPSSPGTCHHLLRLYVDSQVPLW